MSRPAPGSAGRTDDQVFQEVGCDHVSPLLKRAPLPLEQPVNEECGGESEQPDRTEKMEVR